MKVLAVLLTAAVIFSGCVSSSNTTTSKPIYADQSRELPQLNNISITYVGRPIYAEFDYVVSPAIKLKKSCPTYAVEIPQAQKLLAVTVNSSRVYVYHYDDGSEYGELYYLADQNENDKIDHYKTYSGGWKPVDPEIKYSVAEPILADKSGDKVELIYQGINAGNRAIEIWYREFKDDHSKPVASEVAGYAINQDGPTMISFRGAKIKVLSADNDAIKYEVLKGFQ